ncbi:MAG: hypothetical protein ACREQV_19225, partial [Candidatus Binatia bacterium]
AALVGLILADVRFQVAGIILALFILHMSGRHHPVKHFPIRRVAEWHAPITAMVAVVFALSVFTIDAFQASWSLSHQNVQLFNKSTCGLADEIRVGGAAATNGIRGGFSTVSDQSLTTLINLHGRQVLVAPQIRMYFPCVEQPPIENGVADPPILIVSANGWPHRLDGSPYRWLEDIVDLNLVGIYESPGDPYRIEVFLVKPIEYTTQVLD